MVQRGETVRGELCPHPYAGISSTGEVILRRAEAMLLIKAGTEEQAPSRAIGTWTPSLHPSISHSLLSGSRASLESGKPQYTTLRVRLNKPPPTLSESALYTSHPALAMISLSKMPNLTHTHTCIQTTHWHFGCIVSDSLTSLPALSSAELYWWLSGFRLKVGCMLPLYQMCNQKNVVYVPTKFYT